MTAPQLLALGSAAAAVGGLWFTAMALEDLRRAGVLRRLADATAPGAQRPDQDRRRLVWVVAATIAGGGTLLAGILPGLALAGAAPVAVRGVSAWRSRRHAAELAEGMPTAARALADALSGGHALPAALNLAGRATPGAAGSELARAGAAVDAGADIEGAVTGMAGPEGGGEWRSLVAAILIQRSVGGDLPGLLRMLAESAEDGTRVESGARATLAQAKATAHLIGALPLVGLLAAEVAAPGNFTAITQRPLALALFAASLLLGSVATLILGRMAASVDR